MISTNYTLGFRRKRQGKTNYKKRLTLLKSQKLRVVIRKSVRNITVQIVEYQPDGDKVIVTADSKELKKYGWDLVTSNLPASYLTGFLLAKKALNKNLKEGIIDLGLQTSTKGSRIYAVVKGIVDGGFNVPHSEEIFPSDERISGKHIETYANSLKENKKVYEKQFSAYLKAKKNPEEISKLFNKTKEEIDKGAK